MIPRVMSLKATGASSRNEATSKVPLSINCVFSVLGPGMYSLSQNSLVILRAGDKSHLSARNAIFRRSCCVG